MDHYWPRTPQEIAGSKLPDSWNDCFYIMKWFNILGNHADLIMFSLVGASTGNQNN